MKPEVKENFNFQDFCKDIPLETRLKVNNEAAFINLIVELGYRESKMWTPDEDELFGKLLGLANKLTQWQLEAIEEWKKDGEPK